MTRRTWVRLDNASNIFLAAHSEVDPKVFRISAEMDHEVDPQLLQEALDTTYNRYPLYHAVLRRAVFWYYLQDSDQRPSVTADEKPTCAPIYDAERHHLLFRVSHHHERVNLEVFHALSDGTGALWFLTDLVAEYIRLRRFEQNLPPGDTGDTGDTGAAAPTSYSIRGDAGAQPDDAAEPLHELVADSFARYFRRRKHRSPGDGAASGRATEATAGEGARPSRGASGGTDRSRRSADQKVYRPKGTRTPDHRTRAVELTVAAKPVLALAKAEGVGLTMYLTALFFESLRLSSGGLGRTRTLAATVPVNLRQFFPSMSPRNFFATIRVAHTYGEGSDDLGAICRQLDTQFRPKATPEALETKMRKLIRFERMPVLKILSRPLKDVILKLINWGGNRGLSVSVSNLGLVKLPETAEPHVRRTLFHVSAVRPQMCAMSHAGLLTISFTSPFTETDHIREFARMLTAQGIDVTVAAARVTEAELADVGGA